jgi:hypothetical protein
MKKTQEIAHNRRYQDPFLSGFKITNSKLSQTIDFGYFIKDSIADRGLKNFVKIAFKRILSGRISFIKA